MSHNRSPANVFVYYRVYDRLRTTAIETNRKMLLAMPGIRIVTTGEPLLSNSSWGEELSWLFYLPNKKLVFIDIVLVPAPTPTADINTDLLKEALQNYCNTFQCSFWYLPDHMKQAVSDVEMVRGLICTDLSYTVNGEHECLVSGYESFSEGDIAEMSEIFGAYQKLSVHAHNFCIAVQFWLWAKSVFIFMKALCWMN